MNEPLSIKKLKELKVPEGLNYEQYMLKK